MIFRQLYDPDTSTYTYLLADGTTREALLIDPVLEQVDRDLTLLEEMGLTLTLVLETHVHADHVTGASVLHERTGAKLAASHHGPDCLDIRLHQGETIGVGAVQLEVLETPGHTDDSLCYRLADRVFTGDTVLIRRTGRSDFQNGDPGDLYDSVTQKLFTLPEDTLVFPCHDYAGRTMSTIGEELRLSTVAQHDRASFIDMMNAQDRPRPRKFDVAVPANLRCGRPD